MKFISVRSQLEKVVATRYSWFESPGDIQIDDLKSLRPMRRACRIGNERDQDDYDLKLTRFVLLFLSERHFCLQTTFRYEGQSIKLVFSVLSFFTFKKDAKCSLI